MNGRKARQRTADTSPSLATSTSSKHWNSSGFQGRRLAVPVSLAKRSSIQKRRQVPSRQRGSLISSLREIGPFTIRPIWAIRLLGLMTVGVTDRHGVMPSGPPTRTVAVAARRETIVLFPCRVWPPDPGTPWQDQWPNESGSVPSPLQVEYRHLAKGLASPDTTAKRS